MCRVVRFFFGCVVAVVVGGLWPGLTACRWSPQCRVSVVGHSHYDFEPEFQQLEYDTALFNSSELFPNLDLEKLNYTRLKEELDVLVDTLNLRKARNLRGRGGQPSVSPYLGSILNMLNLRQVIHEIENSLASHVTCSACKVGVGVLQHYIQREMTPNEISRAATTLCISINLETKRVCRGIINLFKYEVVYVFERLALSPDEVCGIVVGSGCSHTYTPWDDWSVDMPNVPKKIIPRDNDAVPKVPGPTLKVLHLSDNHYDPYYVTGSNADCGEPLCCRATDGPAKTAAGAAGIWGDYRHCDMPKRTIDHMYHHIALTHPDIDYIIWTGDLP
ncbi:unnamed protein product, partial [Cyprideis torosa]